LRSGSTTRARSWPNLILAIALCGCHELFSLDHVDTTGIVDAAADGGVGPDTDFVQVAVGGYNSCVLRRSGDLFCWGAIGPLSPRLELTDVQYVSVGDAGICATLRDGTARCGGDNPEGALGVGFIGATGGMMLPVLDGTAPASDIVAIAVGATFSCALRTRGYATCVGEAGVRGDSTTDATTVHTTQVSTIRDFNMLAAGNRHVCGIRSSDQTMWCWGLNLRGQLGVTPSNGASAPQKVAFGTWKLVTAGDEFTCAARTSDGAVFCWGANDVYQTGDGGTADHETPTLVADQGNMGATSVAAGAVSGYFAGPDGRVLAWGGNSSGQIGDGTKASRPAAVSVALPSSVVEVTAGTGLHACARTSDDRVFCWGANNLGQLGIGNTIEMSLPVEVTSFP
jgi:alpha-tubulin suppressor-like RCC1 family protein